MQAEYDINYDKAEQLEMLLYRGVLNRIKADKSRCGYIQNQANRLIIQTSSLPRPKLIN